MISKRLIVIGAATAAVVVAIGAVAVYAAVSTGGGTSAGGGPNAAPQSSAVALTGTEVYLAGELSSFVVPGDVIGGALGRSISLEPVTNVFQTRSGDTRYDPQSCQVLTSQAAAMPAGFRAATSDDSEEPAARSEVYQFSSPADAQRTIQSLARASGSCSQMTGTPFQTTSVASVPHPVTYAALVDTPGLVSVVAGTVTDATAGRERSVFYAQTGNVIVVVDVQGATTDDAQASAFASTIDSHTQSAARSVLADRAQNAASEGLPADDATPADASASAAPATTPSAATGSGGGASAAPLTLNDMLTATIPHVCQFEGQLVGGVLPGYSDRTGGAYLEAVGYNGAQRNSDMVAFDPTPTVSSAAAAVIVGCNGGGVSWPDTVVLYSADKAILGSVDLSTLLPNGFREPAHSVTFDGTNYHVQWWHEVNGDGYRADADFGWNGSSVVVTNVLVASTPSG